MEKITAVEYRFLSQAMAYPDNNLLVALKEIKKIYSGGKTFPDNIIKTLEKEELTELQAEHTRLFISGYPHTPCPPYESFFREGRLFGNANTSVRNIYLQWQMEVEPALADHIATEFEFLSFLTALKETVNNNDDAKKTLLDFFYQHIIKWVPKFAEALKSNTQNNYYKLYADILLKKFNIESI